MKIEARGEDHGLAFALDRRNDARRIVGVARLRLRPEAFERCARMLEAEMVVDFDEDDDRKYDRLIELAVEHSREVIESNPRQALQGLKVIIRDEDGKMLFEVKFGPKELGLTLH